MLHHGMIEGTFKVSKPLKMYHCCQNFTTNHLMKMVHITWADPVWADPSPPLSADSQIMQIQPFGGYICCFIGHKFQIVIRIINMSCAYRKDFTHAKAIPSQFLPGNKILFTSVFVNEFLTQKVLTYKFVRNSQ